jgi:hypothetical protein
VAPDPNWYAVGESSTTLDTNDSATLRYLAGRLKSTGQWDDLGLTANPTTIGTISAILESSDGSVYIGGNFTGWNGNAGDDYCVRYDPEDGTFNTLVGASDLNGRVFVASEGPDGTIYLGGTFTAVDGDADRDYVVAYNPSDDTWSDVGTPDTGAASITDVRAMAWDSEGNFYVGGNFTNFADASNADYFAKWDGTSWTAVGSGGTGAIYAMAIDSNDNIYIGGAFTNWAADANADYWAWWDGTSWAAVNDIALSAQANGMAITKSDELYIAGNFTNVDSVSNADYVFMWDGKSVSALSTGANDNMYDMEILPTGDILVSGEGTEAGGITLVGRVGLWNGSSWSSMDIDKPGLSINAMESANEDAVINQKFDLYISFTASGTGYFSGTATVTNDGTTKAYPLISVERSGGTSARLVQIRNETTGKVLLFDYSLLDGEELTIDLAPQSQLITSSFFGGRPGAHLAGDDLGQFALAPGSNQITAFVDVAGAPTVTAYMLYNTPYKSQD